MAVNTSYFVFMYVGAQSIAGDDKVCCRYEQEIHIGQIKGNENKRE